jgi:hypothetical protein
VVAAFLLCAFVALDASAAPPPKRLPLPAGTPSPLNAYRTRPTILSTTPPHGATVPAYAVNLDPINGNAFVFLDAANPGELTLIAPTSRTLVGGAFIANDFSRFYVIDADTADLLWLDTSDGSENLVGPTGTCGGCLGETWTGLAADPTAHILYGTTTDLTSGNPSTTLYAIDWTTGLATIIGSIGGRVVDIALSATPTAPGRGGATSFGIDTLSDTLVDLFGGTAGPLGFDAEYASLIDFDGVTGTLYLAAIDNESPMFQPDQMYTVDTTTGAATLVGGISADPLGAELSAFAIALPAGTCSTIEDIPWLSESPTGATTTGGTSTTVTVTFDATLLTAGIYTAELCITSNDPDENTVHVPVTLTVQ